MICRDWIWILNEKGSQCECHHSNNFWKGIAVSTGIQCYTSIWTGISKSTKSLQVFCTTNIHSLVWRKPWLAQNRSTFRRHIDLWLAQNIPVNKEHMLHSKCFEMDQTTVNSKNELVLPLLNSRIWYTKTTHDFMIFVLSLVPEVFQMSC